MNFLIGEVILPNTDVSLLLRSSKDRRNRSMLAIHQGGRRRTTANAFENYTYADIALSPYNKRKHLLGFARISSTANLTCFRGHRCPIYAPGVDCAPRLPIRTKGDVLMRPKSQRLAFLDMDAVRHMGDSKLPHKNSRQSTNLSHDFSGVLCWSSSVEIRVGIWSPPYIASPVRPSRLYMRAGGHQDYLLECIVARHAYLPISPRAEHQTRRVFIACFASYWA